MTAFAAESETQPTPGKWYTRYTQVQERIATRQAQIEQKRQEVSDFKAAAQEKSALVKAARDENKALLQTVTTARKDLAKTYDNIKANGLTLDASTLEQLSNYSQQVRNIMDELMASKGSIQSYIESNKESLKSLDYEVLESMYADIAEIQSWRNEQLNEINRILNEMLALVQ
jgi:chromosome segregation ATPase